MSSSKNRGGPKVVLPTGPGIKVLDEKNNIRPGAQPAPKVRIGKPK